MRFLRHAESIGPMGSLKPVKAGAGVPPPVGRLRGPAKGRDGRSAPCSSSAMSSDRLFLDRVARQQSPSPLHRHPQINMHSSLSQGKEDISTLRTGGHFYFALTEIQRRMTQLAEWCKILSCGTSNAAPGLCSLK
jgi:hypothetical protein